ncbi:hypothetical protein F442_09112, partial [Phytophthora nicotianae P10297]
AELAKPTTGNGTHARRKAIPANTRVAVAVFLATRSKEGHLRYGTVSLAVKVFYISRAAIEQIWALRNEPSSLVLPRKAYPRRSTRLSKEEIAERVAAAPLCQRQTIRSLAAASGIARSTLHRHLKNRILRRFICRVKPKLSEAHKLQRLSWALDHVQRAIGTSYFFINYFTGGILYRFDAMYDVVHIDEKWFNMYKASTRYYLSADASLPYRPCLNKRYIGKVLFIAAQRCYVLVLGGEKEASFAS